LRFNSNPEPYNCTLLEGTEEVSICQGQTYNFHGTDLDESGIYTQMLTTADGCDSLVTLDLTIEPALEEIIEVEICQGSEYDFHGQILDEAGSYEAELTTSEGCDSIVTLNLTIAPLLEGTETVSICQGQTYNFHGTDLDESGIYTQMLTTDDGCDSLVTLDLTIEPALEETIEVEICQGSEYDFHGQILDEAGSYEAELTTTEGCDSIVTLNLTIAPLLEGTEEVSICQGQTYNFHGTDLDESGIYTQMLTTDDGCDSLVTLDLTIEPALEETIEVEICQGSEYDFHGQILDEAGTYQAELTTTEGCDSIVTLNLTIAPLLEGTEEVSICQGQTYNFHGTDLDESGIYTQMLTTTDGCDSLVTLDLTIEPALEETIEVEICQGSEYDFHGQILDEAGSYVAELTTSEGCDSIVTLNLTIAPLLEGTEEVSICQGQTYNFHGTDLDESGIYTQMLTTADGCDSLVTLDLTIEPALEETIEVEICQGSEYDFHGQILDEAGSYVAELTTSEGCDSIVTLNLTIAPLLEGTEIVSICQGQTYNFHGTDLDESGIYTQMLTTADGCDSLVTLDLTIDPALEETIEVEICQGSEYDFHGQILDEAGSYVAELTTTEGCDSIVTPEPYNCTFTGRN
jgi:hypothetical protein